MKKILLTGVLIISGLALSAQCTWVGGTVFSETDWHTASNWSGCSGSEPTSSDAVVINSGGGANMPEVTGSASALSIKVSSSGITPAIAGSLTITSGTLTVNGDITLIREGLGDATTTPTVTLNGGTLNLSGAVTIEDGGYFDMNNGDLVVTKATGFVVDNNLVPPSFDGTGGTIHFSRTDDDTQVIDVATSAWINYPDIEIDGGKKVTVTSALTGIGNLTVSDGHLVISDGNSLAGAGNFTLSAGEILTIEGNAAFPSGYTSSLNATSTVNYNKDTDATISLGGITYGNLVINSPTTTLTFDGSGNSIATLLDVDAGTVEFSTNSFDGAGAATIDVADNATIQYNGTLDFPTGFSTYTFGSSSTVIFNGTNQNIGKSGTNINFGNLTVQGGSGTKTLVNDITILGNLLVSTSTTLETTQNYEITGGSGSIEINDGTIIFGKGNLPTFSAGYDFAGSGSSTVIFNDSDGDQTVSNGNHTFDNLTLNGGNTKTIAHGISITNGGNLTIDGGGSLICDAGSNTLGGDFNLIIDAGETYRTTANSSFSGTISETLNATSNFEYNGDDQQIEAFNYGNLTLTDANSSESPKTLQGNADVAGTFTNNGYVRFITNGNTINGTSGSAALSMEAYSVFEVDGGATVFPWTVGTIAALENSTIEFGSTITQDIPVAPMASNEYWNLTLSGGSGLTYTIADGNDIVVKGILSIKDGARVETDFSTNTFVTLKSWGDAYNQTARIADLSGAANPAFVDRGSDEQVAVVCQRDMDLTGPDIVGWNDWASPMSGFRLANWYYQGWPMTGIQDIRGSDYPSNPFCSVLTYDASDLSTPYYTYNDDGITDLNDGWVRGPSITTSNAAGTGFRLYTGARDKVITETGTPNQGTFVINLNYESIGSPNDEGWNLVGNPYMSTIDFNLLGRTGSVDNKMWMYSNENKGYYAWNGTASVGTAPFSVLDNNSTIAAGLIPSHKSFWVKVSAASQTLTIEETDKNTTGTDFIKSGIVIPKLRMQVQNMNNGYLSAAVLALKGEATFAEDKYDNLIFKSSTPTAPNLSLLSSDNKELSINTIPEGNGVIPVMVEAGESGEFELTFYDFKDMPTETCLWLEDKFTNEWFDIRENPSIVRALSDTTTVSRFNIHLSKVMESELLANSTCFGTNDGQIMVENLGSQPIGFALYNQDNELVAEDMVNNTKVWSNLKPGVYTIREKETNFGCASAYTQVEVHEPKEVIASFETSVTEIDLASHNGEIQFTSTSKGATEYIWFFADDNTFSGEANPTHIYATPGTHDVSLVVHNGNVECASAYEDKVIVKSTVGIAEEVMLHDLKVFAQDNDAVITYKLEETNAILVSVFDLNGKQLVSKNWRNQLEGQKRIKLPETQGVYLIDVQIGNDQKTFTIFK